MLRVRDAVESDDEAIRDIFVATYGNDYAYPAFYDLHTIRKLIYADDNVLVVAEDEDTGRVIGTGSVVLQSGAYADLVGEFGRLVVHPDARGKGCANRIMEARIERVQSRLHLGLVENRVMHPYSQKVSASHGFTPLGFIPHKLRILTREHISLYGRYFGDSLSLRRNHPRIIPEAAAIAELVLAGLGLRPDAIIDDHSASYPQSEPRHYELEELTTAGYATLLRIERGRVRHREIFGPMRLHYGLFQLQARHSSYLIARRDGQIAGAIGYVFDELERNVRVLELISVHDGPIRYLLETLLETCRQTLGAHYVEVDVSAYAPHMQRTLLELGFLPVAYIPALVFHDVERLDGVRMVRLLTPFSAADVQLHEQSRPLAELVIRAFEEREIQPRIAEAAPNTKLFHGLNAEQSRQLATICRLTRFRGGEQIVRHGEADGMTHVLLSGAANVIIPGRGRVGVVAAGECLGEMSLLEAMPHSATAVAVTDVETAAIRHTDFTSLVRMRPDIAAIVFRNLASGLG
ncbi:MAG: GNAT family N-acetyltransferase, partial [Planctomycetales bacterium]|nr:GNAT family N-acetyltransferase [Planctomycetales bacterium]